MNLLPCPFCGCEAVIIEATEDLFRAFCMECPASMTYDGSKAALKAMWNSRRDKERGKNKTPAQFTTAQGQH
jgi:Lar family restriction alleviation protein